MALTSGHSRWAWVAAALVTALGVAEALPEHPVGLTGLLLLSPFLAAATTTPMATGLVAVYAVAVGVVVGVFDHTPGDGAYLAVLGGLVLGGGLAVFLARQRARGEATLAQTTRVSEAAQRAILREIPTRVGPLAVASRYLSASEKMLVGGDFLEVLDTPHGVRAVVGDVRGKGMEAIELSAVVVGAFRVGAYECLDLSHLAVELDATVVRFAGHDDEAFVTVLLVEYRPDGRVLVANCGHHPPLVIASSGEVTLLVPTAASPPLGLGPRPSVDTFTLRTGERLLCYTDGALEGRDAAGKPFALVETCGQYLRAGPANRGLDELLERILAHVGGGLADDLALLLLAPVAPVRPMLPRLVPGGEGVDLREAAAGPDGRRTPAWPTGGSG